MNTYLTAFAAGALLSLVLTRAVREWAKRHGLVDRPDEARKLHRDPVPRVGGIALYLSVLVALGIVCLLPTGVGAYCRESLPAELSIAGLSGAMMLVGLWDDVKHLSPRTKFLAQIVVAIASWFLGFRIFDGLPITSTLLASHAISLTLTAIWIVGVSNAFNLLDGIDGLAAGAALFAMVAMLFVSMANGQMLSIVVLAAMAGATLGFLRYNFNPASIFLGDSGSLFLGFTLALLAVRGSQKSSTAFAIAVPIVAFGLPVLDMAVVVLRRFLSGKPLFSGDRRHIHHVLIERGLKPRNIVVLLYGVCGFFGLISLMFLNPGGKTVGFALAILSVCVWFAIQQLHYPELRELNGHVLRGITNQRKLIAGSVAIGKMLDGFRVAQQPADLLASLSAALEELQFSRAELRLQGLAEMAAGQLPKNWILCHEDPQEIVFCWHSHVGGNGDGKVKKALSAPREIPKNGSSKPCEDSDFRLEFEIHYRSQGNGHGGNKIGTLVFYHREDVAYPVSAISLLSRNVWGEFEAALTRILQQTATRWEGSSEGLKARAAGSGAAGRR